MFRNPELNPDEMRYRRWTYNVPEGMTAEWIIEVLERNKVTPETHPKVIDLCSGDGSVAAILIQHGWKKENIVCVDHFVSPEPLVDGMTWKYFSVWELANRILTGKQIDQEIFELKGKFDLVTLFQGHIGTKEEELACRYFVKPEGYVLNP